MIPYETNIIEAFIVAKNSPETKFVPDSCSDLKMRRPMGAESWDSEAVAFFAVKGGKLIVCRWSPSKDRSALFRSALNRSISQEDCDPDHGLTGIAERCWGRRAGKFG